MASGGLFGADQRGLTTSTMTVIAVAAYNNLSVGAALPSIGDQLGDLHLLPWVVTIELITAAIAVLAVGPLIDAIGTRRIFRSSLIAFTLTCVACAAAPTMLLLVAGRALQGLAGGVIIANVMAAIGLGVPEALRARAYAVNSSVWGLMGLAGPALAALLLTVAGWQWIFLINIPVAVVAGVVGWNRFPEPTQTSSARPDSRGLVLMTIFTLVSLVGLSIPGWWTLAAGVVSVVVGVLYVAHERGAEPPVLRVRHVIDRPYRLLHLTAVVTIASGIGSNTFLTLWVKGVRGFSTGEAAFTVIFLTVGWTTGAFISSRVVERRSGADAILAGTAVLAISVTTAAVAVATEASVWIALAAFTGVGLGMGSVSSAGVTVLQAHARPSEMGRLMSAHQFIRTLGFSYGAALSGSVLFGVIVRRLGDAEAVRSLLGDDAAITDPATIDALQDGFATSTVLMAAMSWVAFWFGVRLWRRGGLRSVSA